MLFFSKTTFVDDVNNVARIELSKPEAGIVTLSADITKNLAEKALFVRLAVKTDGVLDAIYSKINNFAESKKEQSVAN